MTERRPKRQSLVSILVLVDVSPEVHHCKYLHERSVFQSLFSWMFRPKMPGSSDQLELTTGFNPCSRGCFARSPRGHDDRKMSHPVRVSILVLVDVSPEAGACSMSIADFYGFQSLFSWMFRPKTESRRLRRSSSNVSILVLVDVSPEAPHLHRAGTVVVSFNPCSRGVSPEDRCHCTSITDMMCFNPCSRGCFARSSSAQIW